MEKVTSMITKFKSDVTLRIENTVNELQRRSIEIKECNKVLEELRKYVSCINEGLSIALAMGISREAAEDSSN
jgi:hypothetical protein